MRIAFIDYISNGSTHFQFNLNQINSLLDFDLTVYLSYDSSLIDVLSDKKIVRLIYSLKQNQEINLNITY